MTILLRCSALLFACALFALTQARAQKPEPPVYASGHYQIAVAVVEYESHDKRGGVHSLVSAFVGAGNVCGTIEFYGETPVHGDNAALKPIIEQQRRKSRLESRCKLSSGCSRRSSRRTKAVRVKAAAPPVISANVSHAGKRISRPHHDHDWSLASRPN